MKCAYCGSCGATVGEPCWSCGKGGATRAANTEEARKIRGGGAPRRYAAFGKSENMGRRGTNRRNGK